MSAGRTLLRALLCGAAAFVVLLPANAAYAEPTLAELQAQIDKGYEEVEHVIEAYNKINGDLAATQAAMADLQKKMEPLQSNVDAAYVSVSKIAYAAYRGSSLRTASLLLNASSSTSFMDQVTMLDQISKTQSRDIATFTDAKKGFDVEKKRLDELLAAQNAQKVELETKKAKIEGDLKALEVLVAKAKSKGAKSTPANTSGAKKPAVSGSAGKVVDFVFAQLGKPYKYGAAGPSAYDCSGLTAAAWKQAGVTLPHNAASQYSKTKRVAKADLVPGDLVFSNGLGHVGVYIGNGQMIHAPNSSRPVEVGNISFAGYYGAGRP